MKCLHLHERRCRLGVPHQWPWPCWTNLLAEHDTLQCSRLLPLFGATAEKVALSVELGSEVLALNTWWKPQLSGWGLRDMSQWSRSLNVWLCFMHGWTTLYWIVLKFANPIDYPASPRLCISHFNSWSSTSLFILPLFHSPQTSSNLNNDKRSREIQASPGAYKYWLRFWLVAELSHAVWGCTTHYFPPAADSFQPCATIMSIMYEHPQLPLTIAGRFPLWIHVFLQIEKFGQYLRSKIFMQPTR